jgi:5-methylcytosine-specific restriction endonuclease McrA
MAWKNPEERRAYEEAHREESRASCRAYYEAHREECRALSRAWKEAHKEECLAYARAYGKAHREKRCATMCAWQKANPQEVAVKARRYRARKRGATIGPIDIEAIRQRDRMLCCICGKKVTEKDFSLDHTVPLSLGGPHSQENLRVAHRHCNSRRGPGRLPVQMVLC